MKVGILTVSDRASAGDYQDVTGTELKIAVGRWTDAHVSKYEIVPDDRGLISKRLMAWADVCNLVITNGGTGLSARDVTPEATLDVIDRSIPGIAELMRYEGFKTTPLAAISRQVCGQLGKCLIINLPGSPRGAIECLTAIEPVIPHAVSVASNAATGHD